MIEEAYPCRNFDGLGPSTSCGTIQINLHLDISFICFAIYCCFSGGHDGKRGKVRLQTSRRLKLCFVSMFACGRPLLLRIPNVKLFTTTAESTSQTNVVQQSLNSTTPPMGQDSKLVGIEQGCILWLSSDSGANSGQSSSLRSKSSRYVHKNSALRTKRASQAEDNTMQSAGPKAYSRSNHFTESIFLTWP